MRRERQTSRHLTAKSISINDAKRKSDGCARKAVELTSGGLSCVPDSGLGKPQGDSIPGQKSAEGILGDDVGKASEALRNRKVESTDRLNRKRWRKARTIGEVNRARIS